MSCNVEHRFAAPQPRSLDASTQICLPCSLLTCVRHRSVQEKGDAPSTASRVRRKAADAVVSNGGSVRLCGFRRAAIERNESVMRQFCGTPHGASPDLMGAVPWRVHPKFAVYATRSPRRHRRLAARRHCI